MRTQILVLAGTVVLTASACATGGGQIPGKMTKADSQEESIPPVTRAEAADLLVQGISLPERLECNPSDSAKAEFALPSAPKESIGPVLPRDAVGSPHLDAVALVVCVGLRGLEVRPDGRFEPDRPIRRAEWVLALVDLVDRLGVTSASSGEWQASFPDVPGDHFAREAAAETMALGLIQPREDGRFDPTGSLTRGEAIASTQRLRDLLGTE